MFRDIIKHRLEPYGFENNEALTAIIEEEINALVEEKVKKLITYRLIKKSVTTLLKSKKETTGENEDIK